MSIKIYIFHDHDSAVPDLREDSKDKNSIVSKLLKKMDLTGVPPIPLYIND